LRPSAPEVDFSRRYSGGANKSLSGKDGELDGDNNSDQNLNADSHSKLIYNMSAP
jgi:hypothetical protein